MTICRSSSAQASSITMKNRSAGDPAIRARRGAAKFSASYYFPYQGHASMGPSCAVADCQAGLDHRLDRLAIHPSLPHHLRRELRSARIQGAPDLSRWLRLLRAECPRRRSRGCRHSVARRRQPCPGPVVRQDEHGWDPKGPPEVIDMRAGAAPDGSLTAWETELWVPMWISTKGTIPLVGLDAAGIKQRQGRWPGSVDENLDPPYTTPNVTVTVHRLKDSPAPPRTRARARQGRKRLGGGNPVRRSRRRCAWTLSRTDCAASPTHAPSR